MPPPLEALVVDSPDPARARRSLSRLAELWPAELPSIEETLAKFIDDGAALVHLLAISPISADKLVADPEALTWLARQAVHDASRGVRRMRAHYDELGGSAEGPFDENFRVLRRWKARELLRIALREVTGRVEVEQTTLELTCVAELCVSIVTEGWLAELTRRLGKPATDFAVLGMGKFGGQELNYSSDIDVIFFYGEDGRINPRFTHLDFFTRLAEKIVGTFSANDPTGALFRIDLRLRPEGGTGPLVRSLDSMEHYYAAFGETWERMALIKARVVAGSTGAAELGYEFGHRLQPFIYSLAVSPEMLEGIRLLKGRIEREIVGSDELHRNVKLGYGGIREIEFVTQTLQILHGASHPFLQERSTLKALRALQDLDLIPTADMRMLSAAYRFLRVVEHRLQIENEAQTHTLPADPEALACLERSLALPLAATLAQHAQEVRAIFDKVLGGAEGAPLPATDLSFFAQPAQARKTLAELDGSATGALFGPRTKQLAAKLAPLLLGWLREVPEPDRALTSFVRFVERYGARGLLYETLLASPRVLEVMVKLFDASRFMTGIVLRRPQLIEEVARGGGLGEAPGVAEHLAGLARNEEQLAPLDAVRAYRRAELLRIGLRDVLGFATLREVQAEYSALAEACLIFTQEQLGLADELTIVALGKFGGRELSYGADLDVIFIGDRPKAASELIRAMTLQTEEGSIFPVDARLRPEGESGVLAVSLASYEAYFEKRGQLWEAQALTKSRPVSGPEQRAFAKVARRVWRRFGAQQDLFAEIAAMHARIIRERAGADDLLAFKTGRGGLMQVEFFTQAQQMRAGIWEPNTLKALRALAAAGVIRANISALLSEQYLFLRKIESVLRRDEDTSISRLPAEESAQRAVARRCGFESRDDFLAAYREAREIVNRGGEIDPPS
jgi:glutamate-ammonia-ligase adenylyltransferase